MNTNTTLAAIALTIGSLFSSASFAQSGTITFTGAIVAPACTGSINTDANRNTLDVSLDQCANSEAQVIRTSIDNANHSNTSTTTQNNNSAVVTVSYE